MSSKRPTKAEKAAAKLHEAAAAGGEDPWPRCGGCGAVWVPTDGRCSACGTPLAVALPANPSE